MLNEQISLQDAAVNLLATGYSVSEVAEIFNIDSSIVRGWWRADPLFRLTVEALQEQITTQQQVPKKGKSRRSGLR